VSVGKMGLQGFVAYLPISQGSTPTAGEEWDIPRERWPTCEGQELGFQFVRDHRESFEVG